MARRYHDPEWERLDHDSFRARQLELLTTQLTRIAASNPFYQRHWKDAGLDLDRVTSLSDFAARVPLTTKQDMLADQRANPPFGDRLGVERSELVGLNITSGTTGIGQEAYGLTAADLQVAGDAMAHQWTWAGLKPGDVVIATTPVTFLAAGLAVVEAIRQSRLVPIYGFGLDKKLLLELIVRHQAACVFAVPNLLIQLQQLALAEGYTREDFASVRAIVSPLIMPPFSLVEQITAFWGAPLYDVYGCTQSSACPAAACDESSWDGADRRHPTHFIGKHFLCEVINPDTGRQVAEGESGELVLTTLRREASPVVRFAMRDRVTYLPHTACPCGRPYDGLLPGETGRYDDMRKVKGMNVWPPTVDNIVFAHPEIDEYRARIVLTEGGREELLMSIAYKPGQALSGVPDEALRAVLADEIKAATLVRPRIGRVDELSHFDFKPQRWTDERGKGLRRVTW
jgi:phenylacetate-CoA ligase